jgi:hypothetical protein
MVLKAISHRRLSAHICLLACLGATGIAFTLSRETACAQDSDVVRVGSIQHRAIVESSGLAASKRYPGIIWTHNDSGSIPFLFAMRQNGGHVRAIQVKGAAPIDWEDISIDNFGNLYVADIGANGMARTHVAVHRVPEPNPGRDSDARVDKTWYLRFPARREDCESFFVSRTTGYLVTKERKNGNVAIFGFPLSAPSGQSIVLRKIAIVEVTAAVTAADLSADARRLALLTEEGAYVFVINGNVAGINSAPSTFTRFENTFMEGACFTPRGLMVSAETRQLWLFTDPAFRVR